MLSSQAEQIVVCLPFKHVLQLPCLQSFVIVPSMHLFLLFVYLSSGTGLIVPCETGVLFGCSVLASDLLQFLDSQILLSVHSSVSVEYNSCWFSLGSVCRKSVVHPQHINHTSTKYIPNIEVATRLSQVFVCSFCSIRRVSCL